MRPTGRPGSGLRQNGDLPKRHTYPLRDSKLSQGKLWRENSTTGTGISAAGVGHSRGGWLLARLTAEVHGCIKWRERASGYLRSHYGENFVKFRPTRSP